MKKFYSVISWIVLFMTGKSEIVNEAIKAGLVDYSGQGRDRYGR